jgi:hypothetical protein
MVAGRARCELQLRTLGVSVERSGPPRAVPCRAVPAVETRAAAQIEEVVQLTQDFAFLVENQQDMLDVIEKRVARVKASRPPAHPHAVTHARACTHARMNAPSHCARLHVVQVCVHLQDRWIALRF